MLTVYLKLTNYCNIGCDFCYLPDSVRSDKERMSLSTLAGVTELINSMLRQGHDSVFILYHGGEPLTLPDEYLWKCSDLLHDSLSASKIIEGIQTSLIPLKESHLDFIHSRCDSVVGSSIDLVGRTINSSADAYQSLWMKKVKFARENGIDVTPTIVPSTRELGRERNILEWLISQQFNYFNIDRYSSLGGYDPHMPSNAEHSNFLIELYKETILLLKKGISIRNNVLDAAFNGLNYGIPGDRWGGKCQSNFIVVNPDGDINSCPDRIEYEEAFGNVNRVDPIRIINSQARLNWVQTQEIEHRNADCSTCDYSHWCRSGCPITQNKDRSLECSGYSSFLNFISNHSERHIYEMAMENNKFNAKAYLEEVI